MKSIKIEKGVKILSQTNILNFDGNFSFLKKSLLRKYSKYPKESKDFKSCLLRLNKLFLKKPNSYLLKWPIDLSKVLYNF